MPFTHVHAHTRIRKQVTDQGSPHFGKTGRVQAISLRAGVVQVEFPEDHERKLPMRAGNPSTATAVAVDQSDTEAVVVDQGDSETAAVELQDEEAAYREDDDTTRPTTSQLPEGVPRRNDDWPAEACDGTEDIPPNAGGPTVVVQCPGGSSPGDMIEISLESGALFEIVVPENIQPGEEFTVELPFEAVSEAVETNATEGVELKQDEAEQTVQELERGEAKETAHEGTSDDEDDRRAEEAWAALAQAGTDLSEDELLRRRRFLLEVPLFADLVHNREFVDALARVLEVRTIKRKTTIVEKGGSGVEMFFIVRGEVEVLSNLETAAFATLEKGNYFGEASLLGDAPANAFVRAKRTVQVYALKKECLLETFKVFPEVACSIQNVVADREKTRQDAEDAFVADAADEERRLTEAINADPVFAALSAELEAGPENTSDVDEAWAILSQLQSTPLPDGEATLFESGVSVPMPSELEPENCDKTATESTAATISADIAQSVAQLQAWSVSVSMSDRKSTDADEQTGTPLVTTQYTTAHVKAAEKGAAEATADATRAAEHNKAAAEAEVARRNAEDNAAAEAAAAKTAAEEKAAAEAAAAATRAAERKAAAEAEVARRAADEIRAVEEAVASASAEASAAAAAAAAAEAEAEAAEAAVAKAKVEIGPVAAASDEEVKTRITTPVAVDTEEGAVVAARRRLAAERAAAKQRLAAAQLARQKAAAARAAAEAEAAERKVLAESHTQRETTAQRDTDTHTDRHTDTVEVRRIAEDDRRETGSLLPEGWTTQISRSTGEAYYVNTYTMESTYDLPTRPATDTKGQAPQTEAELQSQPEPQPHAEAEKQRETEGDRGREQVGQDDLERRAQFESDRAAGALRRQAQEADAETITTSTGKLTALRGLGKGIGKGIERMKEKK